MGSKLALYITASTKRITGVAVAAAVCLSVAKFAVITVIIAWHGNGVYLRFQDAVLTGVLVGIGVWAGLMITRERRKYVIKQVQTVARLNHELRNALEVILGSEYLKQSTKGEAILDSVERINRTLDSILGGEKLHKPAGKQLPLAYRRDNQD